MAKTFDDWEIVKPLGEGGAGHVYHVQHKESKAHGALKKLKNPKRLDRFLAEVRAVVKLDHAHVVKILATSLDNEPYFAVFEYEGADSLGSLSQEQLFDIPLASRLEMCEQICDALHAAHQAGLTHRDVKPDNILVMNDRRRAKLCDFGLVYVEDGERHTMTDEQVGSRYYIPPELEDGRADEVSPASDVYSMGKVLYYVVAGQMFSREQHRKEKYDLATTLKNPHLEAISRILDEAITNEPSARFQDISLMKKRIQEARHMVEEKSRLANLPETYRCVFCPTGTYEIAGNTTSIHVTNNGFLKHTHHPFVYLVCKTCGNVQQFMAFHGQSYFPKHVEELRKAGYSK